MSLILTISDITYDVIEGSESTDDTSDGRSVFTCTVKDLAGVFDFQPNQPVTFTDTTNNYTYTGFINDSTKTPLPPSAALLHTINCIDGHYIPDKRYYAGPEYINRYAGDIAADLAINVLAAEGINIAYAVDSDQSLAQWQQGTQNNTTGVNTATGGALQLASAGTSVTSSLSKTADWNTGTFSNTAGGNNNLHLASTQSIKLTSTSNGSSGSTLFQMIYAGSYSIVSGDTLTYSMWIADSSPAIQAFCHLHCTNGNNTGGSTADFFGLTEAGTDLSGYAKNTWYARTVDLSSFAGSTFSNAFVCLDGSSQGTYTAYFHDIKIVNGGTTKVNIFTGTLNSNITTQDFGYTNTTCSVVAARDPISGTWTSPSTSLTPVGIFQSGLISWQASTPTGTSLTVSSSLDGGVTYVPQTNNVALSNILAGASASGLTLQVQAALAITGNDPTLTPSMTGLQSVITPAYPATKNDATFTKHTNTDFSAGTLSNLMNISGNAGIALNGAWRSWSDGSFINQSSFGSASPTQSEFHRSFVLACNTGGDARSRFDFAGSSWNVLDMSITCDIPSSGGTSSNALEYGTTNYGNTLNSYAYVVFLSSTQVQLAKGANSTGAGPFSATGISTFNFPTALSANSWHTIRVQWNGTGSTQNGIPAHTHNVWIDGVQYISTTDATYTTASYVGCRLYNTTGSATQGHFTNFSIVSSYVNTTWLSPNYSLNSVGTCGNSLFSYNASVPSSSTLLAETSIDGGSTWQTATNGAAISGLSNGVSLTGKNLKVRFTFTEGIGQETILSGFTAWVMSQYSSSGNRISSALSLTPVGNVGSTSITWSGIQPANTTINVDTSIDGTNWTNVGTGASGSAQIASLFTPTDPVVDEFDEDTSANYTSTCRTGGAITTWVWDTTHNRLTASGGTNGQLLYNAPLIGSDVDISWVMDTSDNGGAVWRWLDQGDHYSLAVHDASSPNNPNAVELFVVTGGGGGTITPYTAYYNLTTSSTLGTMKQLSETLGTGSFTTKQSTIGTSLGFGELFSFGTTGAWAAAASLLAPSTNNAGFIDDSTVLEGNSFIGGTWIPSVRLQLSPSGTITADIWLRVSIRSSGGTYTSLGDCVLSNQTITGTLATYVFPGTTFLASPTFNTGDKLSFSVQLNVLTNANGNGTLACKIGMSSIANTGLASSQVITPGFQVGSGGATTLLSTTPISFNRGDPHIFRVINQNQAITVMMDGNDIINTGDSTIDQAGFAGFRNDSSGGASSANFYLLRLQYYGQDVSTTNVLSRFRLTSTDPTVTPQVNQYAMSVRDPNIQNGALIPLTSYSILNGNKMTVAAILDDLIKQSGNFWWKIVNNTLIFQAHQATLAPWCLTANDTLVQNASIDNINDHYRNSQWGTGGIDIIALPPEKFTGDGITTTFDLGFPVDSITSITLNNATQTFALKSQSSTGYNWYYTQGQNSIVQDTSAIPLNSAQTLVVTYNAQVKITVNVINPSEVNRILNIDETSGIVDEGEDMSGQNKQAIITNCTGLNTTWGQGNKNAIIDTLRPGLAVGQLLPIFLSQMGVFDGAYLITEIKTTWNTTNQNGVAVLQPWYEILACSGPVVNSFVRFMVNLANG